MATIDSTVSGSSANSYVTLDEADTYWAPKWVGQSLFDEGARIAALIEACRRLEQEQYLGRKATQTQALKFPRAELYSGGFYGAFASYGLTDDEDYPIASDTIPQVVKDAQCELAYALLVN